MKRIKPIDIDNLDGFGNIELRNANDLERLESQVYALQEKLNEIIEILNDVKEN